MTTGTSRSESAVHHRMCGAEYLGNPAVPEQEGSAPAAPRTSFVGRAREITEVSRLLTVSRMVTVVGPGGSGKTRLAVEVLRRHARSDRNVVRMADLSGVTDAGQVEGVVARAMGLSGDRRRLVLLLDNCEHLVAECARTAEGLLAGTTELRLLATSRETLGVSGETVWSLPPLAGEEAARLFAERARARRPDFSLTAANRGTVDEICGRLDRMPLAIELAAARIAMMSVEEIQQRLDDRFALLTGGSRTATERHQTLRSAVEWSHALLPPDEQRLFRLLSVFRGGFDLAAAEAVGGPGAVELLSRLVDKSFVTVGPGAGSSTRYSILETLAVYGQERLLEHAEMEEARRRHLDCMLTRAEAAFRERRRSGSAALLHRLDADLDNLRSALDWCRRSDPCAGVRLVAATREVWFRLGQAEGLAAAREVLERCPRRDESTAWALLTAGNLGLTQLQHAQARLDLDRASQLGFELDVPGVRAWAAWMRGVDLFLAEEFASARRILEEGVELHRRTTDSIGLGLTMGSLGTALLRLGDRDGAIEQLTEGLRLLEEAGDGWGAGFCHTYLGIAHLASGARTTSERHFHEALKILGPIRDVTMLTLALAGLAELACPSDWRRALRLAGAAVALRQRVGGPFPRWIAAAVDDLRHSGRSALGETAARREWDAGGSLDAEAAITLAQGGRRSRPPRTGPLSDRELEIARLVAEGMSNAGIAHCLHLSRRTVENHVLHTLNKLGAANRAQIAAWLTREELSTG